jgi:hypothetical protein
MDDRQEQWLVSSPLRQGRIRAHPTAIGETTDKRQANRKAKHVRLPYLDTPCLRCACARGRTTSITSYRLVKHRLWILSFLFHAYETRATEDSHLKSFQWSLLNSTGNTLLCRKLYARICNKEGEETGLAAVILRKTVDPNANWDFVTRKTLITVPLSVWQLFHCVQWPPTAIL